MKAHTLRMPVLVLAIVACILSLCVSGAVAAREYDLHLVQLLHRHGARSPLVSTNGSLICPSAYPCGALNAQGKEMMVNTGTFLRERYTTDTSVVDPASPFLTSSAYNSSVIYTRSTEVGRARESADALLRGLFPDLTAFSPVINTVPWNSDTLLANEAVPIIRARNDFGGPVMRANCEPVVDAHFTQDQLKSIGAEVYLESFCTSASNRVACAKDLCDVGLSYASTGVLSNDPLLSQNVYDLCSVQVESSAYYAAYNASDPVNQKQGSLGQTLGQQIVTNFRLAASDQLGYRIMHYSAHDTTLARFGATVGDESREALMPPFGSTYVMELLSSATLRDSTLYVRMLRGNPGQTPDTNFVFEFTTFPMQCIDASGATYTPTDNVCPLDDFARFIDASKPTDPAGLCYLDPDLEAKMGCSADALEDTTPLSSSCRTYRTSCPAFCCDSGYTLNTNDLGCYPQDNHGGSSSGSGTDGSSSSSSSTSNSMGPTSGLRGQIAGLVVACVAAVALIV